MNKRIFKLLSVLLITIGLCLSSVYIPVKVTAKTTSTKTATLNKTSVTLLVGESTKIKVKNSKETVKWSSSNKKVAFVSKKGKITAKKAGTCNIIATIGTLKLYCSVTVRNASNSDTNEKILKNENFNSSYYLGGITFPYNNSWQCLALQENENDSSIAFSYLDSGIIYQTIKFDSELFNHYTANTTSFNNLLKIYMKDSNEYYNLKTEILDSSENLGKITANYIYEGSMECSVVCYIKLQNNSMITVKGITYGQSASTILDEILHDACVYSEYGNTKILIATPTPTPTATPTPEPTVTPTPTPIATPTPTQNKKEMPEAYKNLIKFVKKYGVLSDDSFLYLWEDTKYDYDYMINYDTKHETIAFSSFWGDSTVVTVISIDPYDQTIAEVSGGFFLSYDSATLSGNIDMATFEGDIIDFKIKGSVAGYTNTQLKEYITNDVKLILLKMDDKLSNHGISIYDLGFKKF